ncbi:hypothetical protein L6475_12270 [Prevotella sp. E9-3]|uniref:hypothetical protein n=1 Tax=Prevotella sp. E9-3 TaxID=2913621 RepID=UPI001ED9C813|nr:hypothetical protein [Prevotella sp. E9-3]UKK47968.1 hypothetical protein L6475_12270 [Prevotella sp. E9-3]
MKKTLRFMLVSLLTMLCGTVMAEQVTMKYSGTTTTNMTCDGNEAATFGLNASEWSVTADKGAGSNAPGLNKAGDFRLYWHAAGSNTITVSSLTEATINNISMTFNGTSYSKVTVTVNGNPVTADDEGVYTINSTSFVLGNGNTSNVQVRIKEVVIDYTPAGSPSDTRTETTISAGNNQEGIVGTTMNLPAAVVKAGETAIDGAVVTWTSSDVEVAKIDGTTLQLLKAGTATITASFEGDENYKPCQDSFTLTVKEAPVNIANIAAATALENNKEFIFTGEALVVAKPTAKYVYVKDATGSSLIYDTTGEKTTAAEVGKTIAANWTGKVSIYKNLFELVPDNALVMKDGDAAEVTYPEVTAADITAEHINEVVTLKGITGYTVDGNNLTINIGETEIVGYNQFGLEIAAAEEGKTYEMVGAISCYNSNIQFQPIEIKEEAGIEVPEIVNAGFNPEADPLGWDKVTSAQYYDLGMGLIGTYQVRGEHPAATVDETHLATEFAAGLECRWQTNYAAFTQTTAELPAGSYKLTFDVENTNATTTKANYENRFFVKVGETTYTDESTEWMDGKSAWTTHTIAFTLTEASPITISLGYGTGSNNFGVGNTPALFVSHLTLEAINSIEIALIDLQAAIDAAQAKAATYTVGEALFTYAESEIKPLNDAIATAQAAYTAAESAEAVKSATETLNAFVATFAPAMNKPEVNKEYTIINKATSLMLSVANGKVSIENKAIVLFTEVEGGWVISNNAETPEYILKTSEDNWTLSTTTTKEDAYVVNFNLADGAYTIQGAKGLFGTDNTAAGSAIYANKAVANNGLWTIEEWVEKSDLDIAKDQALATINALPVGNKLFYYIENDINTCITNVNNATTIDEVNSAVATAKASQNLPVADEEYCILNKAANSLMLNVADNSVNIAKFATIHIIGVEGGWVISNADKSAYIFKTTGNNWTLENTNDIANAYVVNFNIVDGGYTIQGAKGLFGTDSTDEGSAVYADKNLQKNGLWDIVTKAEGKVTGIETMKAETAQKGIFNLNGQKVMKAQKGLYIINGKKVVVK